MRLALNKDLLAKLSPSERRAAEAKLAQLVEQHKANPLWTFVPHPRQASFLASTDPIKLFLGGNRSGKTTCGVVDDLIQAVPKEFVPPHLLPYKRWYEPFKCRVIVPDFNTTLQGVMLEKIREWAPKAALAGGSFGEAYDARDHMLWFDNGSFMSFMTHEQAVERFQGAALHRVHYDEEPPERIRRENQMRLVDYNGQEVYTMTPLSGMTFTFESFYEPWEKLQPEGWQPGSDLEEMSVDLPQGRVTVTTVDMDDNPHLNEEAKRRIIDDPTLSNEEREARKKGRFISFAGLIYGQSFSRDYNVVPDLKTAGAIHPEDQEKCLNGIPEGAYVFVGIDPGLRHMAAVVFAYLDWRNELVVFDELAMKDTLIEDQCQKIQLKLADWGVQLPRWYVIDPAAQNRNAQTGRSDLWHYQQGGIHPILGQNSVTAGIQAVKARFENAWRHKDSPLVTHSPKLLLSSRCDTLLEQLKRYRWAAPSRSEDEPRERPVKKDDHLLDALRYVVMSNITPPEPVFFDTRDPMQRLVAEDIASYQSPSPIAHPEGPGVFA